MPKTQLEEREGGGDGHSLVLNRRKRERDHAVEAAIPSKLLPGFL